MKTTPFFSLLILLGTVVTLPLSGQGVKVAKGTDITLQNDSYITLTGNQNFLLEAGETETASLIDRNANGQILVSSGKVKDECYIGQENWHYISSPVSDGVANTFFDIYLKEFDEKDSAWTYIADPATALVPMKGYATWASTGLTGSKTVTFYGSGYNAGNMSINVTKHGSAGHNSKGFNFVGNPYPSALNWQKPDGQGWSRTGIDPTFYLWNPVYGNYGNYNRNLKTGINDVDSIIPANQGFFVHVTNNGQSTLQVANDARLHQSRTIYKDNPVHPECLTISAEANGYRDETKVLLHQGSATGFDPLFDAFKLEGYNSAPQLYTLYEDNRLSVNTFPEIEEEYVIPLGFEMNHDDTYTLKFEGSDSFGEDVFIFLKDLITGSITPIETGSSFSFDYHLADNDSRFDLIFKKSAHGIEESGVIEPVIYADNGNIYIHFDEEALDANSRIRINVRNMLGQTIYASEEVVSMPLHLNLRLSEAYYIVNLRTDNFSVTKKILVR